MGNNSNDDSIEKNEISLAGKITWGILLVVFTVLPIFFIIAIWPDKMPAKSDVSQLYINKLFQVHLAPNGTLHINTIMFILVALAGFTGCMIHVATSFTNFIGAGKFKSNWILWYCVKPFTAAAIGLIFYLVLKAGLLNFDGADGANPFGIVILSALAGLFTDKATLKLEEIFTVIFKPKDDRPDKLEPQFKINDFNPKKLILDVDNDITISGESLDKQLISIKINDQNIPGPKIETDSITFKFKIPDSLRSESVLSLNIQDSNGKSVFTGEFTVYAQETEEEAVG